MSKEVISYKLGCSMFMPTREFNSGSSYGVVQDYSVYMVSEDVDFENKRTKCLNVICPHCKNKNIKLRFKSKNAVTVNRAISLLSIIIILSGYIYGALKANSLQEGFLIPYLLFGVPFVLSTCFCINKGLTKKVKTMDDITAHKIF